MSDRCEPPPEMRGVDGWHWVEEPNGEPHLARWFAAERDDVEPLWSSTHHIYSTTPRYVVEEWGWRYLAPVTPPAEVEALREELERERMRLAACGVVALSDTPDSAKLNRDMHPDYRSASCDDVARRVDECMALRATVAALQLDIAKVEADAKEFLAERDTLRATVAQLREALVRIAIHGGWMSRSSRDVARDALARAKGGEE